MKNISSQHEAARKERFGYTCHACSRCCRHKHIQTNPYEIARLASFVGQSSSQFRTQSTLDGEGTALLQTPDGDCVFLGPDGCTVHPARPLVCRLYPLGRHRMGDGSERWHRLEPHPQSLGEYSESGTIGDYLEDQDAQGFIDAADAYVEWVHAATEIMNDIAQDGETAAFDAGILDMDEVVTSWCAARNEAPPSDVEARRSLHLKLLYEELDHLKGGRDEQD